MKGPQAGHEPWEILSVEDDPDTDDLRLASSWSANNTTDLVLLPMGVGSDNGCLAANRDFQQSRPEYGPSGTKQPECCEKTSLGAPDRVLR
jgi:hypothetical protein